ncbi:MAG: hypothetical protein H7288_15790 [Kineosporiaceae bacterium]|nr:hypothetical protein [Aeromicrobium sp.]
MEGRVAPRVSIFFAQEGAQSIGVIAGALTIGYMMAVTFFPDRDVVLT